MQTLPVIPLRGVVVLPGEVIHCDAGRKKTLMAMQAAASNDGLAFFCTQKDAQKGEITFDDLPIVGTICRIRQVFRIHGEGLHMLVTGISRAEVKSYTSDTPYFEACVDETLEYHCDTLTTQALKRRILRDLETWTKLDGKISSDQKQEIIAMEDAAKLAYAVAALLITDTQKKQQILEEENPLERLFLLTTLLSNEVELQRMDKELSQKVQERVEKHQKEYYLREKLN